MQSSFAFRSAGRFLASALPAFVLAANASAQLAPANETVRLDTYIVSATRTLQDPQYTASAVTHLSLPEIELSQIDTLQDALALVPGVYIAQSGPSGSQTSIFLRGASSHQTLFFVDGVRMNDRSAQYFNFLGGADLVGLDRLEVLRGPQSTLYGSTALGGVVVMNTATGSGDRSGVVGGSYGSFDTKAAHVAEKGTLGALRYSGSIGYYQTDNDAPRNEYKQWSYSTRVEGELPSAPQVTVGGTYRGQQGDYQEVGSRTFATKADVEADNHLATAFAQWKSSDDAFSSRVTTGLHLRRYTYTDRGPYPYVSEMRNRREVIDWQNIWRSTDAVEFVAGANYERSRFTINGTPIKDRTTSGFLSGQWRPVSNLTFTGGVRYDDISTFDGATTWRGGVAWSPLNGTKLRATYGTGFVAPGVDDRFGVPSWGQLPNPNLQPEKSRGWDAGIDQRFANGAATLSATYFANRFRNLFEWQTVNFTTFEGMIVNRARASSNGAEFALAATFCESLHGRVAYTYLEASNDTDHKRLIRRPRHVLDSELRAQPVKDWVFGAGLRIVADRADGFAATRIEDYTAVRVFTSYTVSPDLTLKLRVENALDESYEEVLAYASLPRAVFGSIEWRY